ncbi:RNA-binding domain-containing protein [Kordia sp.]|uniref:RNA-binding domain-containing protein n=1 Tax=Kordia sp. TaxID=1965332 RepID=UPI003D2A9F43
MKTETLHTTLHFSSFFNILEDSEKRLLLSILKRREFKKGDVVFSESQCAASVYILEKGSVTLTIPGSYTIFVKRGDVFGEIAVINDTVRLGTAVSRTNCSVLELNTEALYDDKIIPSKIALKITKVIAKKHSSLKLRRSDFSTLEIIQQGESDFVEFKSTLRYNIMSKKKDSNIELSSLKTVAAFLNTSGGTLLIGVADDSSIHGLSLDEFANDDKLLLHFTNLLRDKIGEKTLGLVHYEIVTIKNEQILRVDVSKSNSPVFVKFQNNEYFYVRSGPSTLSLKFSEFYNYNLKHFT